MLNIIVSIFLAIIIYHIGNWLIDNFGMEQVMIITIIAILVFTLLRCH